MQNSRYRVAILAYHEIKKEACIVQICVNGN